MCGRVSVIGTVWRVQVEPAGHHVSTLFLAWTEIWAHQRRAFCWSGGLKL